MKPPDPIPAPYESLLPACLLSRLASLSQQFTRPTWQNVLLLVAGAILAPGKHTVTAALRILGREQENDFPIYHGVLNRAVWSSRAVAGWLLRLLVTSFVGADATVVIGIDDTIERRWGHKISARGIYRDPVRSSKGHFVKTSGLHWLSAQLLVHIPWAGRIMGLPFLTVLAPSKRFYAGKPRSPKTLVDCARQVALQIHRWLPGRRIVLVGDTAFAAIEFLAAVRGYVSVVTRLRLDAALYAPAPPKRPGRGRPPVKSLPRRRPGASACPGSARSCKTPIPSGSATPSLCGMAVPIVSSRSPPAPPSGTTAACPPCPFGGCWSAIRAASLHRRPSSAPISMPLRSISSIGSSRAGSSRSPSRKAVPISASKPSASGPTSRSCAPLRRCSACSRSSLSGRTIWPPDGRSLPEPRPGIPRRIAPSAMPSPRSAARSGSSRFVACPRATGMLSKFPASYGNALRMPSPMPRSSIKSS